MAEQLNVYTDLAGAGDTGLGFSPQHGVRDPRTNIMLYVHVLYNFSMCRGTRNKVQQLKTLAVLLGGAKFISYHTCPNTHMSGYTVSCSSSSRHLMPTSRLCRH